MAAHIHPGTHITAMGADADGKQEIDPLGFEKADIIVADSKDQCIDHGDLGYAVRDGIIDPDNVIELGDVIRNKKFQRKNDQQITIADLTGVAIQDIQITKYVYLMLAKKIILEWKDFNQYYFHYDWWKALIKGVKALVNLTVDYMYK